MNSTGRVASSPPSRIFCALAKLESNETYKKVTQHGAWVHSIGRLSNAIRIPFLLLSMVFQIALLPIRFVVSLLGEGIGRIVHGDEWKNTEHYKRLGILGMNFPGVRASLINIAITIDRTFAAAFNVLYAPPREYQSFGTEMAVILDFGGVLTGADPIKLADARLRKLKEEGPATYRVLTKIYESYWEPEKDIQAREESYMEQQKILQDVTKLKRELKNAIIRLEKANHLNEGEETLRQPELKQKLTDAKTLKNTVLKADLRGVQTLRTDFDTLMAKVSPY